MGSNPTSTARAAGPWAFDCSGLVQYVYGRLGVRLPHNAELQYRDTIHLPAFRYIGPGDLVFFHSGSYVYHVGIYAGHYMIWVTPHSGSHVKLERIWTWSVWFGRPRLGVGRRSLGSRPRALYPFPRAIT